jgi:hypothetical protein
MAETTGKKRSKQIEYMIHFMHFYFAPKMRSVLTVSHFIVWNYVAVYYTDYVVVAIQFFFYTAIRSNVLIPINHLLWGISFICVLALPFVMAQYAIFSVHRIWTMHGNWSNFVKWTMTVLSIVGVFLVLTLLDKVSHFVAGQNELRSFIEDVGLNGRI